MYLNRLRKRALKRAGRATQKKHKMLSLAGSLTTATDAKANHGMGTNLKQAKGKSYCIEVSSTCREVLKIED